MRTNKNQQLDGNISSQFISCICSVLTNPINPPRPDNSDATGFEITSSLFPLPSSLAIAPLAPSSYNSDATGFDITESSEGWSAVAKIPRFT
jgi:hypothetical protein